MKFQKPEKGTPASCRMHSNLTYDKDFGSSKLLKLKYRRGDQIIQPFCRTGSLQEIKSPIFNLWKFEKVWEKFSWIMQNTLKPNEWQRIWVLKTFKIEILKGGPNNSALLQNCFSPTNQVRLLQFQEILKIWEKVLLSHVELNQIQMNDKELSSFNLSKLKYRTGEQIIQPFLRICSPQEIWTLPFNLWKFEKSEKSTPESCRMDWNLMNDEKFWSSKLLKLKYRRGDQIIQPFCRTGSLQEIKSPIFNLWKFEKVWEKFSWIMQNTLKPNEWQRIWVLKTFKIEI